MTTKTWPYLFMWMILPLALAAMACSLSSSDEDDDRDIQNNPTQAPFVGGGQTATQIILQSTATAAVATRTAQVQAIVPTSSPTGAPLQNTPASTACAIQSSWPLYTVQAGDTLASIARQTGTNYLQLASANCLSDANSIYVGQQIYVPVVPPPTTVPTLTPLVSSTPCTFSWFFTLDSDITLPCPSSGVLYNDAVGEDFEGGRAYWYPASAGYFPNPLIYIIYNDGTWELFLDTWEPSQPVDDPSIVTPAGLYQPVRGIGKVWRENDHVRQKLGWAYEPETPFSGRRQIYDINNFYIVDHGKWGVVLRLNASYTWEIVGSY